MLSLSTISSLLLRSPTPFVMHALVYKVHGPRIIWSTPLPSYTTTSVLRSRNAHHPTPFARDGRRQWVRTGHKGCRGRQTTRERDRGSLQRFKHVPSSQTGAVASRATTGACRSESHRRATGVLVRRVPSPQSLRTHPSCAKTRRAASEDGLLPPVQIVLTWYL